MKYIEDKKRVIVLEKDIMMADAEWRQVMRHVLGRHYENIQKKGKGWTFPLHFLDTFRSMVEGKEDSTLASPSPSPVPSLSMQTFVPSPQVPPPVQEVIVKIKVRDAEMMTEESKTTANTAIMTEIIEKRDHATQTPAGFYTAVMHMNQVEVPNTYPYKYDVDETVRNFCNQWIK